MCILFSPVLSELFRKGAKVGNIRNSRSSMTVFLDVPHPEPLVWLVVDSNHFCYLSLGNSIFSVKWRLHLWVYSEAFTASTIYILVYKIPCTLRPALFVGISIPLFIFCPFIMFIGWMVHIYTVKFISHIVIGTPTPILSISSIIVPYNTAKTGFVTTLTTLGT